MDIKSVIGVLESIAETGHAPKSGCHIFGVGFEDAFARLREKYLVERFERGGSAEKFVIGPFGSGKTHFLREMLEIAQDEECVTSEVALNKDIDFTHPLEIYKEVVRELIAPGYGEHGIRGLLIASIERVKSKAEGGSADQLLNAWVAGVDKVDFKSNAFGRIIKKGLLSYVSGDEQTFESACRWLGGEVGDRVLARELSTTSVKKSEENLHGHRSLLSIYQFVKHSGFRGTVVGFDEAEQGLTVDRKKTGQILSMLQSDINALADLQKGSALVIYALTPDIVEKMDEFPALQQRVADPVKERGFFDGETLSPKIDLSVQSSRVDPAEVLIEIGHSLVDFLYDHARDAVDVPIAETKSVVNIIAKNIIDNSQGSGNRRTMAKEICARLVNLYANGTFANQDVTGESRSNEPEV